MTGPAVWAVVPVKAPGEGKSRLALVLGPEERSRLVAAMLERVVMAAHACPAITRVCLVGPSDHGLGDAVTLLADNGAGLNGALAAAVAGLTDRGEWPPCHPEPVSGSIVPPPRPSDAVTRAGQWRTEPLVGTAAGTLKQVQGVDASGARLLARPERVIVIAADLPQVDTRDFAMLADSAPGSIGIAPDRHGTGTNALSIPLLVVPAFRFQYGPGSYVAHRRESAGLGYSVETMLSDGLEKDIDDSADLTDAEGCLQVA